MDPSLLITDSEYLETHLIVVPANSRKEFLKSYETLAPMVVPRSSVEVAKDDEFVLFAVTTFKKHSAEFLQKCREQKWTPRQYKYVEGGKEEEQKELDRVAREEKKVWGEALRLGRTGWSEAVMVWAHVMTLRVFVETVLRYGLPLEYVSALVKVSLAPGWNDCKAPPLTFQRRRRLSCPRRSRRPWTLHTRTWAGTPLGETRKVRSPRTMRLSVPRWQQPASGLERATSTRHMYTMSSTSRRGQALRIIWAVGNLYAWALWSLYQSVDTSHRVFENDLYLEVKIAAALYMFVITTDGPFILLISLPPEQRPT